MNAPLPPDVFGAGIHRATLENMQEAVLVADREGVIRYWNRGAEVLFGFTEREALGSDLGLLVPERFRRAHENGFRHAMATGQLRFEGRVLTTRSMHKYGCRLYVAFSFGVLKDAGGTAVGVVAVGRDVTSDHLEGVASKLRGQSVPASA